MGRSMIFFCLLLVLAGAVWPIGGIGDTQEKSVVNAMGNDELRTAGDIEVFDVTSFGAIADDGKDDTKAILRIIADVQKIDSQVQKHILFPEGRFDFFGSAVSDGQSIIFELENIDNLIIRGSDTELIFHGTTQPFKFMNCDDLRVEGIVIDWERPPFSVGRILSGNGREFEVEVLPEYSVDGTEGILGFLEYDPDTLAPRRNGNDIYWDTESVSLVSEQVLRVRFKNQHLYAPPGTLVILRHEIYGHQAFELDYCCNVLFTNVNIYTAPGMGLLANNSRDITLRNFNIMVRPGTKRLMSVTADGGHFANCCGTIVIEDSIFEGMGDDAVNVHGFYLVVHQISGNRMFASHPRGYNLFPEIGDRMEFLEKETLQLQSIGTVASVTERVGRLLIEFDEPISENVKIGDLVANATRTPKVILRNNVVKNKRCRGFLIQTRDVLIESNVFKNNSNGGVLIFTEATEFYESIGTADVIVRNNVFEGNNYYKVRTPGDITVDAVSTGGASPAGVHTNIVIEGNVIKDTGNAGIAIRSADGVVVKHNILDTCSTDPTIAEGMSAIFIDKSRNIEVSGNTFDSGGIHGVLPIYIGQDGEKDTIVSTGNKGIPDLP